jgi:hypothetical protein
VADLMKLPFYPVHARQPAYRPVNLASQGSFRVVKNRLCKAITNAGQILQAFLTSLSGRVEVTLNLGFKNRFVKTRPFPSLTVYQILLFLSIPDTKDITTPRDSLKLYQEYHFHLPRSC